MVVENVIDLKTNMFHQDFANGDNLSTGAAQLRQIVSEVATSNDWKNWKFKLAKNFGRQEIDVNYQPLPQTITEKEIDDFFDKLVFVVDTPNDTELDEILTSEVGQRYKTLDSDIQSDFILRKINWELRDEGRFLTTEDGQQKLKEAGQQMYKVNLRAVSIDYQVTLRKVHNKDKREDVQAMAAQVRSYLECSANESATTSLFQALRIVTTWPESTAAKLFAALEIIPSYKYKDSYLVLPSKRLATQGEVTSVKMAFESGKFQLLVVVCVDTSFQEMCKKLAPTLLTNKDLFKNKILILITNEGNFTSGPHSPTTAAAIWMEMRDDPWPSISSKLNCIQMNLRESSKVLKFLPKLLTEHGRIAVLFLRGVGVKDFHVSHLHAMFPNYKIVYNQTEKIIDDKIQSEGCAMILAHSSLKPKRIFLPQLKCNPKFVAGVRLSCSEISLYSIDICQKGADNVRAQKSPFERVDTSKMVVCTYSGFERNEELIWFCQLQLANSTSEGDNLTLHGDSVGISEWQRIQQDGHCYIHFSINSM